MMPETKDVIYMSLDLLSSLSKTSKMNSHFVEINEKKMANVKNELFELLARWDVDTHNDDYLSNVLTTKNDKKTELIGLLPIALTDRKKFPKNSDIAKLAENSLNLTILNWGKRSRNEMIGVLISKVVEKSENELDLFFDAWKKFTSMDESKNINKRIKSNSKKESDFVDVWLEFFNHYQK
jgi:hypothetical protein